MNSDNFIKKNNTCIILVCPEHPSNIGAVARAMNNMGAFELRLVNPCEFLHHGENSARSLAMHSQNILENAKIFTSLQDAVNDKNIIIGTTNRLRGHHKFLHSLWDLNSNFITESNLTFVFGRESSGLSNAELNLCSHVITIPTFGETNSLNLAQAVMVVLYEVSKIIFKEKQPLKKAKKVAANSIHIEKFKESLFTLLDRVDYIKKGNCEKKKSAFSKIIAENKLSTKEINIIQGIIEKIQKKLT